MTLFVDTPRERFTPGGRFTFHGLRPEGGLRFAVYISWFTARQFTLRGLHFMVYGCAVYASRFTFHGLRPEGGLRFAVYISWFTAAPVYNLQFKGLLDSIQPLNPYKPL
jgi:hypothetical protein